MVKLYFSEAFLQCQQYEQLKFDCPLILSSG